MSIRNLDTLFRPASVAVIGASNRPLSVGNVVSRNLLSGGLAGPVLPVNPRERAIGSTLCYRSIADLPMVPDLAVVCTPPAAVPETLDALGSRGTRTAVVVTAGFGEAGGGGKDLLDRIVTIGRTRKMRIVGPNCVGIMVPGHGLNASFVHMAPKPGNLAFVTQSGAIATAVVDWANHRGVGFSHVVSLGNMADVDFGDMLDFLLADPATHAILLYIEQVTSPRKFMSAARAAARTKPVIAVKAGRSAAAAKAAASHTGAMAGSDAVYDAALRRAGILRVLSLAELFDAVETLGTDLRVRDDRLVVLTNGGGLGVLAAEALSDEGGRLAALSPETIARLDAVLPPTWSRGNPVDIIGDANGARYGAALEALLQDPGADAVLVLNCPTAIADGTESADAVLKVAAANPRLPVLTNWVGEGAQSEARRRFYQARVPAYDTPHQAVGGFMHLVRWQRRRAALMETPPAVAGGARPDFAGARAILAGVLGEGRSMLGEPEAKRVLALCGVPVVEAVTAATPGEAGAAAAKLGSPLVLKILSRDLSHKSDVGGVRLNLAGPQEVEAAARDMLDAVAALRPGARIDGFSVQRMARMDNPHELIAGIATDAVFGPTILFGKGGVEVEVTNDSAVSLPPLNQVLAKEQMRRTRVWRLLQGYRNRKAADMDAVAATLVRLAEMAHELPEIAELDINPLWADPSGVLALDARIRVQPADAAVPFAIRPYPTALESKLTLDDGSILTVRPIRPEDEAALRTLVERSSPADIRRRFFASVKTLGHETAARLTQIDYDREMALVACEGEEVIGVVRMTADPEHEAAEFAAFVRTDRQGRGLGRRLMARLIDYAASRGLDRLVGLVQYGNDAMRGLCRALGFTELPVAEDATLVEVTLRLAGQVPAGGKP